MWLKFQGNLIGLMIVSMKKSILEKATEMVLTAPQLGVNRRIIAFSNVRIEEGRFFPDEKHIDEWYLLINPIITRISKFKSEEPVETSTSTPRLFGIGKRLTTFELV